MQDKTTVTVSVNQSEAIRRGFNSNSTLKLDIDVSQFSPSQREVIARLFRSGELKTDSYNLLEINQPDLVGLTEALDKIHSDWSDEKAKQAERLAKANQFRLDYSEKFVTDPVKFCPRDCLGYWGMSAVVSYDYDAAQIFGNDIRSMLTPEAFSCFEERRNCLCQEVAKEEAEKKAVRDRAKAEADDLAERKKAQLDAAAVVAGGLVAERRSAGYADDSELEALIRSTELRVRGVEFTGSSSKWGREDSDSYSGMLTDEQFSALKAFKTKLPEGAVVRLFDVHNDGRVDPDDSDSERTHEIGTDRLLIAEAEWKVGEVDVSADFQIGTLPDYDRT